MIKKKLRVSSHSHQTVLCFVFLTFSESEVTWAQYKYKGKTYPGLFETFGNFIKNSARKYCMTVMAFSNSDESDHWSPIEIVYYVFSDNHDAIILLSSYW